MTSSGTTSFSQNRNQLILAAFRKIGAFASGETPDAQSVQDASDALNGLVKHWETIGIHLWTETEGTLWLQPGQARYGLGGSSTDHATTKASWTQTTLTSAAANGAGSISVVAPTGFAAGYYVGVLLDDGSLFWTTESGAPSGSTITLAAPLTDSAAAGNQVFVYATQIERPLRLPAARRLAIIGGIETPLNPMLSRLDYQSLPNKTATGIPTQLFYDPQLVTAYVYVWPAPVDSLSAINFTYYRSIQDFDTAANTPDLPQEWIRTIVWNLAAEIALEYDCPPRRFATIQEMAAQTLDDVKGWDHEPESVLIGVAFDQRGGN